MTYGKISALGVLICAMTVSGCSLQPQVSQNTTTMQDTHTVTVVTSFFPLAKIVETVGGASVTVTNLAGGQEVHAYTPSPRDLQQLRDADLAIVLGGVEPWAEELVPQLRAQQHQVVVIRDHVAFDHVDAHEDMHTDHAEEVTHEHEHEHEDEAMHEEEGAHDAHDHGGVDPHVWVDPVKVGEMVQVIADALVQVDPAHQDTYRDNAAALMTALTDVDAAYRTQLATCTDHTAIVSHEAFGYIARRYHVRLVPIAGLSTMDEPSAQLLATLRTTAQQEHVTHVVAEQNSVQRFAETVARGSNVTMIAIDALERATEHNRATSYPALLMENLHVLTTALGCANADAVIQ